VTRPFGLGAQLEHGAQRGRDRSAGAAGVLLPWLLSLWGQASQPARGALIPTARYMAVADPATRHLGLTTARLDAAQDLAHLGVARAWLVE
jgi:hypothetical protein